MASLLSALSRPSVTNEPPTPAVVPPPRADFEEEE
jgi:hypothetical protein